MVTTLTDAVNHPIELTKLSLGVVSYRSTGIGDGFHHVCTPVKLLQARTSPPSLLILVTGRLEVALRWMESHGIMV